jgi:effector-binding domain-containing protein
VEYSVSEQTVAARPTAVIAATTTWDAFPTLWRPLLDAVWAAARSNDAIAPGRNVMFYKDNVPNVEIGVEAAGPFAAVGRIVPSSLPAGRVAATTHRGRYEDLGAAHKAVITWCDGRGLRRTGARWEIYGHWIEGVEPEVEVYYLLQLRRGDVEARRDRASRRAHRCDRGVGRRRVRNQLEVGAGPA